MMPQTLHLFSLTSTMAPPKRENKSLPLAASSSEDEEVEKEVEEEQKGSAVKKPKSDPKSLSSSDEDEEEEEDASEESDSEPETHPKLKLIVSKPKKIALKPSSSTKSDPKTASSSDDDEEDESEESDSEPATTPKLKPIASKLKMTVLKPSSSTKADPKTLSSSDDDEEKDDESEESGSEPETPPKLKPIASKPKMTVLKPSSSAKSDPKTPSDDDDEEEEDDEPPLPKLKPIASKLKKTVSSVTPLKSSSKAKKRPFESEKDSKRKKKKKKQKVDDEVEEDEEETLKNSTPFQRIWSDEDEIVILKGMIESKKNGVDPLSDLKEFLESIKKSLRVKEVRQEQLKNKIRRLRKKFMNSSQRAKGDEDPVFSKPHELLSYTLMKEIWGGRKSVVVASGKDDVDSVVVADGRKSSSRPRKSKSATASPVRFNMMTLSDDISCMELGGSSGYLHPCVQEWIFPRNDMNMVGGSFVKQGLDLIGDSKKKDFEQKWKSLTVDELKVYLRRIQLVREQTVAILMHTSHQMLWKMNEGCAKMMSKIGIYVGERREDSKRGSCPKCEDRTLASFSEVYVGGDWKKLKIMHMEQHIMAGISQSNG